MKKSGAALAAPAATVPSPTHNVHIIICALVDLAIPMNFDKYFILGVHDSDARYTEICNCQQIHVRLGCASNVYTKQ